MHKTIVNYGEYEGDVGFIRVAGYPIEGNHKKIFEIVVGDDKNCYKV